MLRRKSVLAGHNSQFQSSRKPPLSNRSDNRFDNLSGNLSVDSIRLIRGLFDLVSQLAAIQDIKEEVPHRRPFPFNFC